MMGIVVPETCSAYEKYNKIIGTFSWFLFFKISRYLSFFQNVVVSSGVHPALKSIVTSIFPLRVTANGALKGR